jgi:hypothetical protein
MSGSNADREPKTVAAVRHLRASLDNQLRHARCAMIETRSAVGEEDPAYVTQAQFVSEIEERIAVIDRQVPEARPGPGVVKVVINGKFYGGGAAHDFTLSHDIAHAALLPRDADVDVAVHRARVWLHVTELILPPRIASEEIGDLLEVIAQYHREGRPAWNIYVRAITGIVFAVWHGFGEKIAALKRTGG